MTPTRPTTDRPDVEGIEARADKFGLWSVRVRMPGDADWLAEDIPALIAYIKALEARMVKLEAALKELSRGGGGYSMSQVAIAALGDGDGAV